VIADANVKTENANAVQTASASRNATAVVKNKIIKNRLAGGFL